MIKESIECLHQTFKSDPIVSGIHNKNLEIVTLFPKIYSENTALNKIYVHKPS